VVWLLSTRQHRPEPAVGIFAALEAAPVGGQPALLGLLVVVDEGKPAPTRLRQGAVSRPRDVAARLDEAAQRERLAKAREHRFRRAVGVVVHHDQLVGQSLGQLLPSQAREQAGQAARPMVAGNADGDVGCHA